MRFGVLIALVLLGACSSGLGPGPNEVPEEMAMHQPSDGLFELRKLFAAGHVRAANQADIDTYISIAKQAQPAGSQPLFMPMLTTDYTLVLIRPFKATPQMGEMSARHIIIPVGVGKNDDPNPLFGYYDMATGRCNSPGTNCLGAPKMDAARHARARRLEGREPADRGFSDNERDAGNWAESGTKNDSPRNHGPLEQLAD